MHRFFQKNKDAANDALRKMLPETKSALFQIMDLEQLAAQLKDRDSLAKEESKVIWDRLKVESMPNQPTFF